MAEETDILNLYPGYFRAFEELMLGKSDTVIDSIRRNAFEQFITSGFPTNKNEEWRFTNITPITKRKFVPSFREMPHKIQAEQLEKIIIPGMSANRLVFVNGKYDKNLSLIKSKNGQIEIGSLSEAILSRSEIVKEHLSRYANFEKNPFTALNTGFINDGALVHIPGGIMLEDPVYILFIASGSSNPFVYHPRNLILIGKNSRTSIVEHYVNFDGNSYFTNGVTELMLEEHSVATHTKILDESKDAFHIGSTEVHQKNNSNFTSHSISIGGSLIRNNLTSVLDGERIECTFNGLSLGTAGQLIDNHTTIDHARPNCSSHELYKAILDGRSKGVFNGKIYVRKDAQKTDAKQTNKTLLLSDTATINTKPQLEIFADDVKCTHGATIGYLDSESIFYLRSRGISEDAAREMLTFAFANDVIKRITLEPVQAHLQQIINYRLKHRERNV